MTQNRGNECDFIHYSCYFHHLRIEYLQSKAPLSAEQNLKYQKENSEGPRWFLAEWLGITGPFIFLAR